MILLVLLLCLPIVCSIIREIRDYIQNKKEKNDFSVDNNEVKKEDFSQQSEDLKGVDENNVQSLSRNENKKSVWQQIKSFEIHNSFWWFGLLLTVCYLILGIVGCFVVRKENKENKEAYYSGTLKGFILFALIKAIMG